MIRAALAQMCASDDPAHNARQALDMIAEAAGKGADLVVTPEVTNCVSASRAHQSDVLRRQGDDATLPLLQAAAAQHGLWLVIGSLALKSDPPEPRFANRSFLIGPDGGIVAHYDKMHMFDVQVTETETYKESSGYAPGDQAVVADTALGKIGLSICYDLRFAYLYRALAQAGAAFLTVPAAFSPATGPAHWQPLLQARAIECGAYILAPAQTGQHAASKGRSRTSYGHSMVISPWGEVLADAGTAPQVITVDLDPAAVREARRKIPSLQHDRGFSGPA